MFLEMAAGDEDANIVDNNDMTFFLFLSLSTINIHIVFKIYNILLKCMIKEAIKEEN